MGLINSFKKRTSGFRSRLLLIVSFGILSLALTASVTTAWVTSNRATEQMIAQGLQITSTLATQSVLGLIYESPENAEKALDAAMSFPDISQAGLFYTDRTPLTVKGGNQLAIPESKALPQRRPKLITQTRQAWHFIAPVLTGQRDPLAAEEDLQFQLGEQNVDLLGYVYVVMGKAALREIQLSIFLNNIVIAFSFAVILVLFVNIGIDRLLQPLFKLIEVMEENEKEGTRVYADLSGPKEITLMASVFNRMMTSLNETDKRLRAHGEMLESEVAIRTQELVAARDAALSASQHKSQFLANMSHELRTPLQAIIGYSDVVKEDLELQQMDENAEELGRVIRNADRLLALINSILDMAKIESGKLDLHLQTININALLQEAADTIYPILQYNNNQLKLTVLENQHEVQIDKEKLLQIILNLLSNACKFTTDGTINLIPQLSEQSLSIKVSDTGIGLTETEQQVIFEEFRQIDGSTTRNFEGTGLGLAITKRFCELMGGKISVASEPGKGTTFTVLIPLPIIATNQFHPEMLAETSNDKDRYQPFNGGS